MRTMRASERAAAAVIACALLTIALAPAPASTFAAFTARTENDANAVANAALSAPASLTAALRSDGSTIDLVWAATTSPFASGHRVYRGSSSAGPFAQV